MCRILQQLPERRRWNTTMQPVSQPREQLQCPVSILVMKNKGTRKGEQRIIYQGSKLNVPSKVPVKYIVISYRRVPSSPCRISHSATPSEPLWQWQPPARNSACAPSRYLLPTRDALEDAQKWALPSTVFIDISSLRQSLSEQQIQDFESQIQKTCGLETLNSDDDESEED